jgi:hypothetical protein
MSSKIRAADRLPFRAQEHRANVSTSRAAAHAALRTNFAAPWNGKPLLLLLPWIAPN